MARPESARLHRPRSVEGRLRKEHVRKVVDRRVPGTQRSQAVAVLDRSEDGGRVVLRVVDDEVALQTREMISAGILVDRNAHFWSVV